MSGRPMATCSARICGCRPDSGATQVALSTDAALIYYESFGQNWERAALIKARAVAGDIAAGESLLEELAPFIWRKYLDYAAIADVHAMKRQIHAFRGFGGIAVPGHNIKLGPGGIREIEFFAQTQQLIAGGRQRDLRQRRTLDALDAACRARLDQGGSARAAGRSLQVSCAASNIACRWSPTSRRTSCRRTRSGWRAWRALQGYDDLASFTRAVSETLAGVQRHYGVLFEGSPELTSEGSNMVFAGEQDDPERSPHWPSSVTRNPRR